MLLINDKKLSALSKTDRFVIIYDSAKRLLKQQYGQTIVLDFPADKIKRVYHPNMGSTIETPAGFLQKAYKRYVTPKEDFEVRYYTNQKQNSKGVIKYDPVYINFNGKMILDISSQYDLVFFMLFVSPVCGELDGDLAQYQNKQRGTSIQYVLYDEARESTKEIDSVRIISEIEAMITSDTIGLTHEMLRRFAIGYGLIDPFKEVHIDTVRKLLLNYLLVKDSSGKVDTKKIAGFKNDYKAEDRLKIRQLIKEAINTGIVGIKRFEKERQWCLLTKEGNVRNQLCVCNYWQDHENTLEDYLMNNENEEVKNEIAGLVEMKKSAMDTALDIELDRSALEEDDPPYEKEVERQQRKVRK